MLTAQKKHYYDHREKILARLKAKRKNDQDYRESQNFISREWRKARREKLERFCVCGKAMEKWRRYCPECSKKRYDEAHRRAALRHYHRTKGKGSRQ
jgi:hypothetical protein